MSVVSKPFALLVEFKSKTSPVQMKLNASKHTWTTYTNKTKVSQAEIHFCNPSTQAFRKLRQEDDEFRLARVHLKTHHH